jgi:hypothetical protein
MSAVVRVSVTGASRHLELLLDRLIIPIKTPAGQAEISQRQRRISQRHRTMLLLIDGKRTEAQVRSLSAQAGVPGICFDELIGLGLVAMVPSTAANGKAPAATAHLPTAAHTVSQTAAQTPEVATTRAQANAQPAARPHSSSGFGDDSELPAARSLLPESGFNDSATASLPPSTSWPQTDVDVDLIDDVLERAREMLLRAVRAEAPVAGSLTIFRLRRARTRAELEMLIDEVASRIGKPPHSLTAEQTLRRVRNVLDGRDTSPGPL